MIMKTKSISPNLYDAGTGKSCKTTKMVNIKEELNSCQCEEPLWLLYTKDRNGEIVQFRHGCSRLHYHTASIAKEDHAESALSNMALWTGTTKSKLIELALKHSPSLRR